MNESSVPLYRIDGKPFYNKPRVGSIVRCINDTSDFNILFRVTGKTISGFLEAVALNNKRKYTTFNPVNQDITWELVLE